MFSIWMLARLELAQGPQGIFFPGARFRKRWLGPSFIAMLMAERAATAGKKRRRRCPPTRNLFRNLMGPARGGRTPEDPADRPLHPTEGNARRFRVGLPMYFLAGPRGPPPPTPPALFWSLYLLRARNPGETQAELAR